MGLFGPDQNRLAFQALAAHFGQSLAGNFATFFDVERGGCVYRINYVQVKQNISLVIKVLTRPMPDVELRKESGTDRFGKRIGLNYELQTGDTLFDSLVFVVCGKDTAALQKMLEPAPVRKGALYVIESAQFSPIVFSKDGFTAQKLLGTSFSITVQQFEELLAALEMIERALPTFADNEIQRLAIAPLSLVILALVLGVVAGIVMLIVGNAQYRPLDNAPYFSAIGAGLGAWAVSLVLMGRFLRAKPDAFRAWLTWSILGFGVLPLLAVGGALILNGSLDASTPAVHTMLIRNMKTTRHKNSTSYYMELKSWRPGEIGVEIKVPGSFYGRHSVGRSATVTTKSGWLGWEWVVSP